MSNESKLWLYNETGRLSNVTPEIRAIVNEELDRRVLEDNKRKYQEEFDQAWQQAGGPRRKDESFYRSEFEEAVGYVDSRTWEQLVNYVRGGGMEWTQTRADSED